MKVKKNGLLFLLAYLLCFYTGVINAQSKVSDYKFVLVGKINSRDTGVIQLQFVDKDRKIVIAKTNLINGKFQFSGYINGAVEALLSIDATQYLKSYEASFFLEPGIINIIIPGDETKPVSVTGSSTQKDMELIILQQIPYEKKLTVVFKELENVDKELKQDSISGSLQIKMEELSNQRDKLQAEKRKIEREFIRTNSSSFLSPYELSFLFEKREISQDSAEYFFNSFQPVVRKSYFGEHLLELLNGRKLSQIGMPAPDFEKIDYTGHSFRLSSLKNNSYVLLDFWASWCIPCRQITPILKKFYKRYQKQGFVIVGISWDFNKTAWEKAIVKDSIDYWPQIYGFNPPNDGFRTLYSIPSIPMLILIDKTGIIVGRYNGIDSINELEKKLEVIFK